MAAEKGAESMSASVGSLSTPMQEACSSWVLPLLTDKECGDGRIYRLIGVMPET